MRKIWAFAILLAVGAISCATVAERVKNNTKVTLASVSMENPVAQGIDLAKKFMGVEPADNAGITLLCGLRIKNDNPFALNVAKVNYTAFIEGKRAGSGGKEGNDITVASGEEKTVDLPVRIHINELTEGVVAALPRGKWKVKLEGEITFRVLGGDITLPFSDERDY